MSAYARAARRELEAARLLGSSRVHRSRYQSAPDVEPVTLPCGITLQPEAKTRAKLPALVSKALAQAAGYARPGAVPCVVLSETGGAPLIVLPLRTFRTIAGLDAPPAADPHVAFGDIGIDELGVLDAIAARLRMGRKAYGALDVHGDPRDWTKGALDEALDLAVYLAAALLRATARQGAP